MTQYKKEVIMAIFVRKRQSVSSKINQNGRIVIPAAIRRHMGLKAGDSLLMEVEDGVLRMESHRARIRRIQQEFKKIIPPGGMLISNELIAERREEGRRDEESREEERREREEWIG
jgi:AbrB family looped-hinge helix DNA binding protein